MSLKNFLKKHNLTKWLFFALIVLVFGFFYYFQQGDVDPGQELTKAQTNMKNLTSYNTEVKINAVLGEKANVSFNGNFDVDEDKKCKGSFEIEKKNSDENFFMAGTAFFNDDFYFKLSNWPIKVLSNFTDLPEDQYPTEWTLVKNPTEFDVVLEANLGIDLESKKLVELFKDLRAVNHNSWKDEDLSFSTHKNDVVLGKRAVRLSIELTSEQEKEFAENIYDNLNLLGDFAKSDAKKMKEQLDSEMIDSQFSIYVGDEHILKSRLEITVNNDKFEELESDTKWVSEFYYDEFNQDLEINSIDNYLTIRDMVKKIKNSKENVAFKVNKAEFSNEELENMKKAIRKDIEENDLEKISEEKLERAAINKLAENYLLKRYARNQEWEVTQKDIEDRFEILKLDNLLSSRKELINHLLENRFATSDQVHDYIYIEALKDKMAYEEYKDEFKLPEDQVEKAHHNVTELSKKVKEVEKFPPLEESREQIEKLLLRHKAKEKIDAKIKELMDEAEIKVSNKESDLVENE